MLIAAAGNSYSYSPPTAAPPWPVCALDVELTGNVTDAADAYYQEMAATLAIITTLVNPLVARHAFWNPGTGSQKIRYYFTPQTINQSIIVTLSQHNKGNNNYAATTYFTPPTGAIQFNLILTFIRAY
jgi:hypothetical protein